MRNLEHRRLAEIALCALMFAAGCKGGVEERQIISDANVYLALADAGDPKAYQRLSSSAKKHITEPVFTERIKAEPSAQTERRHMEVVGIWENKAFVQYEVKYGTGPWEREMGFYTKEPEGWMRAYTRQLDGEHEESALTKRVEVAPDPVGYLGLCSLNYKRGDMPSGDRACRMAVQSAGYFPTKRFREIRLVAYEMLALRGSDWVAVVREASEALAFLDKNADLSRDSEGSFRFARLGAHMHLFQERHGELSATDWRLVEEDWAKLRVLCEKGPCAGLGKQVQSMAAGVEGVLAQRRSSTPIATDSQPRGLGGGYRGIKWGSSQKHVIEALGMKPKASSADELTFKYGKVGEGSEKELTCLFYKGELFGVLFEPGLSDGDQQGAVAIFQALAEKYGKGKEITGLVDGLMGLPLIASEWNDGETRIRSTVMDPKKLEEGFQSIGESNRMGFPSSTVKVAYSSIALSARKKQEESESKAQAEREERQGKRAKFAGDL